MPRRIFKSIVPTIVMFILAMSSVAQVTGTFTDARDGKVYKTVKIGNQTWMAENLAFKADSGCWAYNNDVTNVTTYGYLYDWKTAKKVCPKGWHLPTAADCKKLTDTLGGEFSAGGKMKEAGTTYWKSPNKYASNSSGFAGLPGGFRFANGTSNYMGESADWWVDGQNDDLEAQRLNLEGFSGMAYMGKSNTGLGFSVRCVKDNDLKSAGNETTTIGNPMPVIEVNKSTSKNVEGAFTDPRDNKTYKTVTIGTQTWMAENLAYKPASGNYWTIDDDAKNVSTYGYLYDWAEAKAVCPEGWHLPSDAEWAVLIAFLGGKEVAVEKLQSTTLWKFKQTKASTNSSGFNAVPGGYHSEENGMFSKGQVGFWWSATSKDLTSAWGHSFDHIGDSRHNFLKTDGFSVRCIKDLGTAGNKTGSQKPKAVSSGDNNINKKPENTFIDPRDNKIYKTVTIGAQTWMAENLAYKTLSECWAYNKNVANAAKYGYLYTWQMAKIACPFGWHIPTDAEWTELTTYLEGEAIAGAKLKEAGTTHWLNPNTGTNSSGFKALPGGDRDIDGMFGGIGYYGFWWSSTENSADQVWYRYLDSNHSYMSRYYSNKNGGCSVRCIKNIEKSDTVSRGNQPQKPTEIIAPKKVPNAVGTFVDLRDNQTYNTVTIGTQTWMAENLQAAKYNDNTDIPLVEDAETWNELSAASYCWYKNDETTYKAKYGALYSWYTINTGMLCPTGWHVPSDAEWTVLTDYLGGKDLAGGKLKEAGLAHWASPNTSATNEAGFSAVAVGYRCGNGTFSETGTDASWWSSTSVGNAAWLRFLRSASGTLDRFVYNNMGGYSVRCVKGLISPDKEIQDAEAPKPINTVKLKVNTYIKGSFIDPRDNKTYKTVTIGTQTWMAENLAWKPAGGSYWACENDEKNISVYGYLYDWDAAKAACPAGWHLPSDAEWKVLTDSLGGESTAGAKMKTKTWPYAAMGDASNSSGFSALPAGDRYFPDGLYYAFGYGCIFWSSTPEGKADAWSRGMSTGKADCERTKYKKKVSFSVRCIKDK